MVKHKTKILITTLISMIAASVYAHDIAVENADGVTLYYNIINDGKELEVTFQSGPGEYHLNTIVTVIPEEVTYNNVTWKVTRIGKKAFYCEFELPSVTIPNSVTSIEQEAFSSCYKLTSISIGNSVTSIGNSAFSGCSRLNSITIPNSVTDIGVSAFHECSGLGKLVIGNGVKTIGKGAFYGCSRLGTVYISDLDAWCKISFGDYDSNPLLGARNLYLNGKNTKELVIPNSVTSINDYAFYGCKALTSITIPNSVTRIGYKAFNMDELKSVISLIKEPFVVDESIFSSNTFNTATLYVPKGTEDMYKKTNGWKKFLHIEEGTAGINSIIMDEDKNARIYDLFGRRLEKPQKGVNIIGGKKIFVK